jgi:hypothetical protein
MRRVRITRARFLADRQGRTFADVAGDPEQPLDLVFEFFSSAGRQRRMIEAELHHDRPALAGVVRELESHPVIDAFFRQKHPRRAKRLRQAIGVIVRMIMQHQGWRRTGKKGSLGVRAKVGRHDATPGAYHNTGGLSLWFRRAERYCPKGEAAPPNVRQRASALRPAGP